MSIKVRSVAGDDVRAVQGIYAHHVLHGTGTFEESPPAAEEMGRRVGDVVTRGLPWLVALEDAEVIGFAYAGPFRLRSAYRFTAETSIYVSADHLRRGVGRALLAQVIEDCTGAGFRQMLALIGDSQNVASIALHRSFGFADVGVMRNVGFKAGRWLDVVVMQRALSS